MCGIVGLLLLSVGSFTLHNCRAYQNPISNFASMFGQNSNAVFNQNSNFGNGNTYQVCYLILALLIPDHCAISYASFFSMILYRNHDVFIFIY